MACFVGVASAGVGAVVGFFAGKRLGAPQKRIEDIDDKKEMVLFLKNACRSKHTPEYKELYRFLLSVFHNSDRDFDGLVRAEDFDIMVEMAGAVPRKFAFAPTSKESFATDGQREEFRKKAFAKIDVSGTGAISFDEWLDYSYRHICQMTSTLDEEKADLGMDSKERFKEWVIKACRNRRSPEYKELYDLLLSTFRQADQDMDGKVNALEFDAMIEAAADYPRRFGYAPPASVTYRTTKDRVAARAKMFKDMDTDGNGTITFEEWLTFAYKHICSKAAQLDGSLTGLPPAFVAGGDGHPGACPYGFGR